MQVYHDDGRNCRLSLCAPVGYHPLHVSQSFQLVWIRTTIRLLVAALLAASGASVTSARAYTVVDVHDGASIAGTVTFRGEPPAPDIYYLQKNPRVCGNTPDAEDGKRQFRILRTSRDKLLDVVVVLEGIDTGKPFPRDFPALAVFQSRWCTWEPRVGVFVNGQELSITNLDPVVHNPIGYEEVGRARVNHFNVPLAVPGATTRQPVSLRKSNVLKLECLQHQFMHSWVLAVQHPYVALVDEEGAFDIRDIPPGRYTVKAWHPALGDVSRSVTLLPGQKMEMTLAFR